MLNCFSSEHHCDECGEFILEPGVCYDCAFSLEYGDIVLPCDDED